MDTAVAEPGQTGNVARNQASPDGTETNGTLAQLQKIFRISVCSILERK